jgi:hypothetical protein
LLIGSTIRRLLGCNGAQHQALGTRRGDLFFPSFSQIAAPHNST